MNGVDFVQSGPELGNTFIRNRWLKAYLQYKLPKEVYRDIEADLISLGERCGGAYLELAKQAEREKPVHVPFGPFGERVDEIRTSSAWQELKNISAREGLIHIAYQRSQREYSRLYQFSKIYLFHPSSAFFTCPLAMADGAAKVLELHGREAILNEAYKHLTSNVPEEFWTSGQWMTEKTGGSDVSGTSTVAKVTGREVRLYGIKWFSSSTTSEMALALARYEDAPEGSKGLSLFMVPTYLSSGKLNNIEVLRLKDKLGTWALPTAELELKGALAYPVGERDQGVKTVATMLNITRLYNSICACGQMTRALDLLRDYSAKRSTFGQPLTEHILHQGTFAAQEMRSLASFLLTMEMVHRLGKDECGTASSQDQDLLRLFTPITKMFSARSSIAVASEVVEGFGGTGYIEDSGVAVHLRDSQVFSIWEGASNVMSLDLLRVVQKTSALSSFLKEVDERLKSLRSGEVVAMGKRFAERWNSFQRLLDQWLAADSTSQVASSRDLANELAWHYSYVLLLVWSDFEKGHTQETLLAWLSEMELQLGVFKVKSKDQCQNSKRAFTESLKV